MKKLSVIFVLFISTIVMENSLSVQREKGDSINQQQKIPHLTTNTKSDLIESNNLLPDNLLQITIDGYQSGDIDFTVIGDYDLNYGIETEAHITYDNRHTTSRIRDLSLVKNPNGKGVVFHFSDSNINKTGYIFRVKYMGNDRIIYHKDSKGSVTAKLADITFR